MYQLGIGKRGPFAITLALTILLAGILAACVPTPEPTEVPPTQTPWIVIVTATQAAGSVAQAQPTQTPWIIVATPTPAKRATTKPAENTKPAATAKPAESATADNSGTTAEPPPTTAAQSPTASPSPTATPTATTTPAPGDIKYPAPVPLDPPSEGRVSWRSRVLLAWTPVDGLAEDEYYRLDFDRLPTTEGMEPYGDYVFVKDNEYLWEKAALAPFHPPEVQGDAMVYWWVRIVRKTGEDGNGKPLGTDISPSSEKWSLILEPKPEGE